MCSWLAHPTYIASFSSALSSQLGLPNACDVSCQVPHTCAICQLWALPCALWAVVPDGHMPGPTHMRQRYAPIVHVVSCPPPHMWHVSCSSIPPPIHGVPGSPGSPSRAVPYGGRPTPAPYCIDTTPQCTACAISHCRCTVLHHTMLHCTMLHHTADAPTLTMTKQVRFPNHDQFSGHPSATVAPSALALQQACGWLRLGLWGCGAVGLWGRGAVGLRG